MRRRELTQEGTLESDGRGCVQAPATAAPPPRARGEQDGRSSCSSRWEGRTTAISQTPRDDILEHQSKRGGDGVRRGWPRGQAGPLAGSPVSSVTGHRRPSLPCSRTARGHTSVGPTGGGRWAGRAPGTRRGPARSQLRAGACPLSSSRLVSAGPATRPIPPPGAPGGPCLLRGGLFDFRMQLWETVSVNYLLMLPRWQRWPWRSPVFLGGSRDLLTRLHLREAPGAGNGFLPSPREMASELVGGGRGRRARPPRPACRLGTHTRERARPPHWPQPRLCALECVGHSVPRRVHARLLLPWIPTHTVSDTLMPPLPSRCR